MTDQKQAPERFDPDYDGIMQLEPCGQYVYYIEYDAAIKQRDELAEALNRLNANNSALAEDLHEALSASAAREIAMRDRAAAEVPKEHMLSGHMIRSISDIQSAIRSLPLSPDGQQALDDVRAEAWDDGWICRPVMGMHENPYRTQPSRSSDAGKSEDRG